MFGSVKQFLAVVAKRGSWFGGGSVAACTNALAAALLEKLSTSSASVASLNGIRQESLELIEQDAVRFSQVIAAIRAGNKRLFAKRLRAATEVPFRVFFDAQRIQKMCRLQKSRIRPQFHSDLHCVTALAQASAKAAEALINTNLAWLKDKRYAKSLRKRMQRAISANAG